MSGFRKEKGRPPGSERPEKYINVTNDDGEKLGFPRAPVNQFWGHYDDFSDIDHD